MTIDEHGTADVDGTSVSRLVRLFAVAVAVNIVWEMAQMRLYARGN